MGGAKQLSEQAGRPLYIANFHIVRFPGVRGQTTISVLSGEENQGAWGGVGGLLSERAEIPLYSNFSYSQVCGGGGGARGKTGGGRGDCYPSGRKYHYRKCLSVEYKCDNSPRRKYANLHRPYPIVKYKPVIATDSVNFSIHTVRLKLGTIFPREMPTFPGGPNNLGLSYYLSGGESDI